MEMSLGNLLDCWMAMQMAQRKERHSVQMMEMNWEKLMEIMRVTWTDHSTVWQKVMQMELMMATSWVHLKEDVMVMQKVWMMEIEKVQMMETPMEISLVQLLAVRTAMQMVTQMGSNWVHLTEICWAQLKVELKATSLVCW